MLLECDLNIASRPSSKLLQHVIKVAFTASCKLLQHVINVASRASSKSPCPQAPPNPSFSHVP